MAGRRGVVAAALAAAVGLGLFAYRSDPPPERVARVVDSGTASGPVRPATASVQSFGSSASQPSASRAPEPAGALGSNELPRFEVDDRGDLLLGVQTRNELERLVALNEREQAQALLRESAAHLPAGAARQANDAYFAWQNYSIALARAFPPGQPVTDEAGAAQQLDALHALRVQQFGPEVAKAYFGDEEETARRLLGDMQAQGPAGLSFAERAERAQRQEEAAAGR